MSSLDLWVEWIWKILTGVFSLIAFFLARMANRDKVTQDRMKETDVELISHKDRLTAIETKLQHLPTHQDMALLHEKINECTGIANRLEGGMQQVSHSMRMIQQHLIERD